MVLKESLEKKDRALKSFYRHQSPFEPSFVIATKSQGEQIITNSLACKSQKKVGKSLGIFREAIIRPINPGIWASSGGQIPRCRDGNPRSGSGVSARTYVQGQIGASIDVLYAREGGFKKTVLFSVLSGNPNPKQRDKIIHEGL